MGRFSSSISWFGPQQDHNGDAPVEQQPVDQQPVDQQPIDQRPGALLGSDAFSAAASGRRYFLPLHYTPSYRYPAVVWLHCNGFNENQIDDVMPYISLRNYVGIGVRATKAADAVGHRFDWHQTTAGIAVAHDSIIAAIDEASQRFSLHAGRIVLAGYREGGTMALRIAMRQPERFAAAISLGGRMPTGSIRNVSQLRQRRLPMLWQWGGMRSEYSSATLTQDCRLAMTIGGQVEVRQYPGDDEMDTAVLRDTDEWIMRSVIGGSATTADSRWASSPTLYSSN